MRYLIIIALSFTSFVVHPAPADEQRKTPCYDGAFNARAAFEKIISKKPQETLSISDRREGLGGVERVTVNGDIIIMFRNDKEVDSYQKGGLPTELSVDVPFPVTVDALATLKRDGSVHLERGQSKLVVRPELGPELGIVRSPLEDTVTVKTTEVGAKPDQDLDPQDTNKVKFEIVPAPRILEGKIRSTKEGITVPLDNDLLILFSEGQVQAYHAEAGRILNTITLEEGKEQYLPLSNGRQAQFLLQPGGRTVETRTVGEDGTLSEPTMVRVNLEKNIEEPQQLRKAEEMLTQPDNSSSSTTKPSVPPTPASNTVWAAGIEKHVLDSGHIIIFRHDGDIFIANGKSQATQKLMYGGGGDVSFDEGTYKITFKKVSKASVSVTVELADGSPAPQPFEIQSQKRGADVTDSEDAKVALSLERKEGQFHDKKKVKATLSNGAEIIFDLPNGDLYVNSGSGRNAVSRMIKKGWQLGGDRSVEIEQDGIHIMTVTLNKDGTATAQSFDSEGFMSKPLKIDPAEVKAEAERAAGIVPDSSASESSMSRPKKPAGQSALVAVAKAHPKTVSLGAVAIGGAVSYLVQQYMAATSTATITTPPAAPAASANTAPGAGNLGSGGTGASSATVAAVPTTTPNPYIGLFVKEKALHFQIEGDQEGYDTIKALGLLSDTSACYKANNVLMCNYPATKDGFIINSEFTHLVVSLDKDSNKVKKLLSLLRKKVGKTLKIKVTGDQEGYDTIKALGLLDDKKACNRTNGVLICNYPATKQGYVLKSVGDDMEISFAW